MDWTEEAIATLRLLWAEGLSTAEIGRRMGISKNAVVGKAHRLNLAARPSPIRRVPGQPIPPRAPRALPRPAMPRPMPMMPAAARPPMGQGGVSQNGLGHGTSNQGGQHFGAQPRQPQVAAAALPRTVPARFSSASCCWPIGEPGKPGFRFCGSSAIAGKPYCEEHAALAYVRAKPDRREDAA
jgi:GcrA cell cycle regulator